MTDETNTKHPRLTPRELREQVLTLLATGPSSALDLAHALHAGPKRVGHTLVSLLRAGKVVRTGRKLGWALATAETPPRPVVERAAAKPPPKPEPESKPVDHVATAKALLDQGATSVTLHPDGRITARRD